MVKKKIIKIKLPKKEDFSDVRLAECFNRRFLKKLQELSQAREDFKWYLKTTIESFEDNGFKGVELNRIKRKIIEKSHIDHSIFLMDRRKKGKELFYKKFKEGKKCLLCSRRQPLEECHILKQSFFRNKKRIKKHYKNFRNHLSNIIFLCPTHHRVLDKSNIQMSKTKIRRIINHRIRLNKKMIKEIDKELKNIHKLNNMLDKFNDNIKKIVNREIKQLIRKI
jgi:hypothetical protein